MYATVGFSHKMFGNSQFFSFLTLESNWFVLTGNRSKTKCHHHSNLSYLIKTSNSFKNHFQSIHLGFSLCVEFSIKNQLTLETTKHAHTFFKVAKAKTESSSLLICFSNKTERPGATLCTTDEMSVRFVVRFSVVRGRDKSCDSVTRKTMEKCQNGFIFLKL